MITENIIFNEEKRRKPIFLTAKGNKKPAVFLFPGKNQPSEKPAAGTFPDERGLFRLVGQCRKHGVCKPFLFVAAGAHCVCLYLMQGQTSLQKKSNTHPPRLKSRGITVLTAFLKTTAARNFLQSAVALT